MTPNADVLLPEINVEAIRDDNEHLGSASSFHLLSLVIIFCGGRFVVSYFSTTLPTTAWREIKRL